MERTIARRHALGLVALLLAAPAALQTAAGQARWYTSLSGKPIATDAPNLNADCGNPADPCRVGDVLANDNLTDGEVAIMVSGPGELIDISSEVVVADSLDFQLYRNAGTPTENIAGTIKFSGPLTITASGVISSEPGKVVRLITAPQLTIIPASSRLNIPGAIALSEPGRLVRLEARQTCEDLAFDELTIAGRTQITIEGCPAGNDGQINITGSLTVNGQLRLPDPVILNIMAAPEKLSDAFVEVTSAGSVESFGAKLRINVSGYAEPDFAALDERDVYRDKTCFEIRAAGELEVDLEVMTAQYVCVRAAKIGAGGISTIHAGTVEFGTILVDGGFANNGTARTTFDAVTLTRDLWIDGRWLTPERALKGNPILSAAEDGIVTPAEYGVAIAERGDLTGHLDTPIVAVDSVGLETPNVIQSCLPDRRPGVHLGASSIIEGDLILNNIQEQIKPAYRSALAEVTDADGEVTREAQPQAGHYAVPCQSGLFLHNRGATTVMGTVLAQELDADQPLPVAPREAIHTLGGYVYLGGTRAAPHNLVVEGDVRVADTRTVIEMAAPAVAASLDGCSEALPMAGAEGNKLIFAGDRYQSVKLSTNIADTNASDEVDDAIDRTLNVAAVAFDKAGGVVALETGTAGLRAGVVEVLRGQVVTGTRASEGSLLSAEVVVVMGGGGTLETEGEAEVYAASPSTVVYAGGDHVVGQERGTADTVTVVSSGVVTLPADSVAMLRVYAGTAAVVEEFRVTGALELGNTGRIDVSEAPLDHAGLLAYTGNQERDAGPAWAATASKDSVTDRRDITIHQDCEGPVGLEVNISSGYTPVGGDLSVTRGRLDLNGSVLVTEPRKAKTHTITVGEQGTIKDSAPGLGLMVGEVPPQNTAPTTTHIRLAGDQTLPPLEVFGGTLHIHSDNSALTLPVLTMGAHSTPTVQLRNTVAKVEVTDLNVHAGTLLLFANEKHVTSHNQTGGSVTIGGPGSYTVSGPLVVTGEGAHLSHWADVKMVLKGDVTVMPTGEGAGVTIPEDPRAVWEFAGDSLQALAVNVPLGYVSMAARSGLQVRTNVTQSRAATLTLAHGAISTDSTWTIQNQDSERDLAVRTAIMSDEVGTVKMGSRASFIAGRVSRPISHGTSGMGSAKGGYVFPTGVVHADPEGRQRYRPLIINYAADVVPPVKAAASLYTGDVSWPEAGLEAGIAGGGRMILDTYVPVLWKVELDTLVAFDALVRVAADGVEGVNDANGLRLVQWDCDGTNLRLAGAFDLSGAGLDEESVAVNGRIDGVPNTTMEGVELAECNLLGLAANYAQNPIGDEPPAPTSLANVQFIQNVAGVAVDVYVEGSLVVGEFASQTATPLASQFPTGTRTIHVTTVDSTAVLTTREVEWVEGENYTVVVNGSGNQVGVLMMSNTRTKATALNTVDLRVVHGAASTGMVDLRSLTEATRWANNLSFNEAAGYRTAEPLIHAVEIVSGQEQVDIFQVDLRAYIDQAIVLALSGEGPTSAEGLQLVGVTKDGQVFFPTVVTTAEVEGVPAKFALKGNYPNPFNPTTRIQVDLPVQAEVTLEVVDLLGRIVMTLPEQTLAAGARRTIELDGSALASGAYLYRVRAEMPSAAHVATGRMVLIK